METIVLSPEAWRQLLAIEDADPNEALLKAAAEHREEIRSGRITPFDGCNASSR